MLTNDERVTSAGDSTGAAARLLEIAARNADELLGHATTEADSIKAAAHAEADRVRAELERRRATVLGELAERQASLEAEVARLEQLEGDIRARTRDFLTGQLEQLESTPDPGARPRSTA